MAPPLLPNTDFSTVQYFSGDMAYVIANPVFDGLTQYLGHLPKLTDASLDPSGVLSRVSNVVDPFKVSQVGTTGSVITWVAGQVRDLDAGLKSIASGQLNLPADSYCYVFLGQDTSTGVVTVQYVSAATDVAAFLKLPVLKTLMAQVITVSTNITVINDLRSIGVRSLSPPHSIMRLFGGQSQTDWVATQGQVVSGNIVCRNATIPPGVTITVNKYVKFVCSGTWTNNGTINQTRPTNGATYSQPVIVKYQTLDAATSIGLGMGSLGSTYEPALSPFGSGGGQGGCQMMPDDAAVYSQLSRFGGGDSGATVIVEAFGAIVQNGVVNLAGAAGGNGASALGTNQYSGAYAGCGGGSGGLLQVTSKSSVTFTATGSTNVSGGNGGNGVVAPGTSALIIDTSGGFGASGGYVDIYCNGTINTTGHTFLLSGGVCGTPGWNGSAITVLGTGVYRRNTNNYQANVGGIGAAFAGIGGFVTNTFAGNLQTMTYTNGGVGLVRTFNFNPIF
jgi:hypothetical protein